MFKQSEWESDREAYRKIMEFTVPMCRIGDSFDVANAAASLPSDAAKYITVLSRQPDKNCEVVAQRCTLRRSRHWTRSISTEYLSDRLAYFLEATLTGPCQ